MLDRAGILRGVVNATREDEWDQVAAMAAACPERVVAAYGIHPWHADTVTAGWEDRLRERLSADPEATVGECGLDGVAAVDPAAQVRVFSAQLGIARELGRVVTVHCVRAWGAVVDVLLQEAPPRFLMHGYAGSLETAGRLIPMGGWFSANDRLLDARRGRAMEVFRRLPLDRVVLESDAGVDEGKERISLPDLESRLACELELERSGLAQRLEANAAQLFAGSFR